MAELSFSALEVQYLTSGLWKLTKDLSIGDRVVKAGYTSDFASIPRPLWSFISPTDIAKPSIMHDYALTSLAEANILSKTLRLKKWREANKELREDMDVQGRHVSSWKKKAIFVGVELNALYKCLVLDAHPNKKYQPQSNA